MFVELIEALHDDLRGQHWRLEAKCRDIADPDVFWSSHGRAALVICASCPVRQQCYDYAIETKQRFGIFGGVGAFRRKNGGGKVPDEVHGTRTAYDKHRAAGEYPCEACMASNNERIERKRKKKVA